MKVDTDGIQNRILGLEITPGNYRNIRMLDDGRIFYLRRTAADDVGEDDEEGFPERDRKSHLCVYNLDDRKETVLGDVNNYQITFDGKKMLLKIKKDYAIIDVPKDKLETKDHEHKIAGSRYAVGSTCRVEPNLLRMLAANARFLLFAYDERRRLEGECETNTLRCSRL